MTLAGIATSSLYRCVAAVPDRRHHHVRTRAADLRVAVRDVQVDVADRRLYRDHRRALPRVRVLPRGDVPAAAGRRHGRSRSGTTFAPAERTARDALTPPISRLAPRPRRVCPARPFVGLRIRGDPKLTLDGDIFGRGRALRASEHITNRPQSGTAKQSRSGRNCCPFGPTHRCWRRA